MVVRLETKLNLIKSNNLKCLSRFLVYYKLSTCKMSIPIQKETLLYCNVPYKKYRLLGFSAVLQVGFVTINLLMMPSKKLMEQHEEAKKNRALREPTNEELFNAEVVKSLTFMQRIARLDYREILDPMNVYENLTGRPWISIPLIGFSLAYTSLCISYTRRVAHMISLLPNGYVRFSSFTPFGFKKSPSILVAVRDVSCVTPRQAATNYAVIKIRGYRGTHLIHKTHGQFLEPKLFDEYLGQTRSWATDGWWKPYTR